MISLLGSSFSIFSFVLSVSIPQSLKSAGSCVVESRLKFSSSSPLKVLGLLVFLERPYLSWS